MDTSPFYKGFEKAAAPTPNVTPPPPVKPGPFEKLRQAIKSPTNIRRGRIGAAIVAPLAIAGLAYKGIDNTIGAHPLGRDI